MPELVYRPIIWTAKTMFAALGARINVIGVENIPREGGAILAMNHTSYLDFTFGGYPADRRGHRLVRFMAKKEIFAHPVAGPLMRGMHHIPVDRDNGLQAFRDAVAAAKAGELVGIFPEATMSRSFDIKEIKNGAVRMAVAANVPLIPMIVFGGHRILSYNHRDLSRGKAIEITIGEPMNIARGDDMEAATEQLRTRLQGLLAETVERYPQIPADRAGTWWLPARFGGGAPTLDEALAIEERVRAERAARRAARDAAKRDSGKSGSV